MTDSLLDTGWLNRLARYHRLLVGLSGGLDSTVMLHCLSQQPQLASKVTAVHVHHGLSCHADEWLAHCQTVCTALSIPIIARRVKLDQRSNIEEHARIARYDVFATLLNANDALLLGHHADDQAETLLLQLLRGAGVDGLAAMPAVKRLNEGDLVRPFLQYTRAELEAYADFHQLIWVEDDSNQDSVFSRNYLRHQIMPLLRVRWPSVVTNLARSASHCQQARVNLHALAEIDCNDLKANTLHLSDLKTQDNARLVNVLRTWLTNNRVRLPPTHTFNRLITDVIFARHDSLPCVEWDGICVRKYQDVLYLLDHLVDSHQDCVEWTQFPQPLQLGHDLLCASHAEKGLQMPIGARVHVRFRQGGEVLIWHGQTKSLKKLFQEWRIPPWQRDTLPLIYINDSLAAVIGYAVSDQFYGTDVGCTYQLELQREPSCLNP